MDIHRLGKILSIVVPSLFILFILASIEASPTKQQKISESYWEKYESNGLRATYEDRQALNFSVHGGALYLQASIDTFRLTGLQAGFVSEDYVALQNIAVVDTDTFHVFFDDSLDYVYGAMFGDNDMVIHRRSPFDTTLSFKDEVLYFKKVRPYIY